MRKLVLIASALLVLSPFAQAKVHNMDVADTKVDVRSEDIAKALQGLQLSPESANHLEVYFFDTSDLQLFKNNLILRGRTGSESEMLVKIRPAQPQNISSDWFQIKGFKCKLDVTRSSAAPDCEMKQAISENDVTSAAHGGPRVESLFSNDQVTYAAQYGMPNIPWDQLRALGPIEVSDWDLDESTAVELWSLPGGYQFLELSKHVPVGQQNQARAQMLQLLSQTGTQESAIGENKTEFAMKIFASQR